MALPDGADAMSVPVLTDAYAQALLTGSAGSWLTAGMLVVMHDSGYVFDSFLATPVPALNIVAQAPLANPFIAAGWASAPPVLITTYDLPRVTAGVLLCQDVSGDLVPRVKVSGVPDAYTPTVLPFWIVWQAEGIFRP